MQGQINQNLVTSFTTLSVSLDTALDMPVLTIPQTFAPTDDVSLDLSCGCMHVYAKLVFFQTLRYLTHSIAASASLNNKPALFTLLANHNSSLVSPCNPVKRSQLSRLRAKILHCTTWQGFALYLVSHLALLVSSIYKYF